MSSSKPEASGPNQQSPGLPRRPSPKLPYRAPEVIDYGSIGELTGTGMGTQKDGPGLFDFSGVNP